MQCGRWSGLAILQRLLVLTPHYYPDYITTWRRVSNDAVRTLTLSTFDRQQANEYCSNNHTTLLNSQIFCSQLSQ